jgi:hypothetical protein
LVGPKSHGRHITCSSARSPKASSSIATPLLSNFTGFALVFASAPMLWERDESHGGFTFQAGRGIPAYLLLLAVSFFLKVSFTCCDVGIRQIDRFGTHALGTCIGRIVHQFSNSYGLDIIRIKSYKNQAKMNKIRK